LEAGDIIPAQCVYLPLIPQRISTTSPLGIGV
jgi:hypothetical protein